MRHALILGSLAFRVARDIESIVEIVINIFSLKSPEKTPRLLYN
jgi:hypothetical protein